MGLFGECLARQLPKKRCQNIILFSQVKVNQRVSENQANGWEIREPKKKLRFLKRCPVAFWRQKYCMQLKELIELKFQITDLGSAVDESRKVVKTKPNQNSPVKVQFQQIIHVTLDITAALYLSNL